VALAWNMLFPNQAQWRERRSGHVPLWILLDSSQNHAGQLVSMNRN